MVVVEAALEVEYLTMEEAEHKVNNQETQELTDTVETEEQDNIHITVQAVVEPVTADNQDLVEVVEKAETVETEEQKQLQVR